MSQSAVLQPRHLQNSTRTIPDDGSQYTFRDLAAHDFPMWDSFVSASPQCSVFCRTWWLQAVCDRVQIRCLFKNGYLVAGIPLYSERRCGVRVGTMPRLTQTLGIVMEPFIGKRSSVANRRTQILSMFALELGRQNTFFQAFHPTIHNWLPFHWAGFRQTTRFTHIIENPADHTNVWDNTDHTVRSEIRKAEKLGIEVHPCSIKTVLDLESKTFERQELPLPHSPAVLERICAAAKNNDSGECFAAADKNGRAQAAGFMVWDSKRAYYIVTGADPTVRTSGAASLLLWHLVRFAGERSQVFDFAGSMLHPIERLFRNFGGKAVPYNFIYKCPFWMHTLLLLNNKL